MMRATATPITATAMVPPRPTLASAQAAAPTSPAAGKVTSQAITMRRATAQLTLSFFLPRPEPMMEPEQTCVVESAKPRCEETRMVVAELSSAAKPCGVRISVKPLPRVRITRHPPT